MPNIDLPLWIVHPKGSQAKVPPAAVPCDEPGSTLAFSSTARLTGFLQARHAGNWNVHLVADQHELVDVLADMHLLGAAALCIDTNEDGSGGDRVSIAEIVTQFQSKRRRGKS